MKKSILQINHLTKYYGNLCAVNDLSITLNKGEVWAFVGPNGAGKSTTIRSIMNLVNITKGNILFKENKLTKDDITLKKSIGYLPSELNLYEDLTVKQMLDFHESFYKENLSKKRKQLVKRFNLDENKVISTLSIGNLKKLGIILAFVHNPELVILDEPTTGLDIMMQKVFFELLQEEKQKGTTIFYSTHNLNEITKVCDKVAIIKEGKLLSTETVDDIIKKSIHYVTITSEDVLKIEKDIKENIIYKDENTLKFKSTMDFNKLIKILSKYDINNILIENASLEDIFLKYYN